MSEVWTIEALKDHFEKRFEALDKAVNKAEAATEKRFEGVNEFRLQLSDQSRTFMPRLESENTFKNLSEKIDAVAKKQDEMKNIKTGGNIAWAYIVSAISFFIALVSFVMMLTKDNVL